VLGDELAGIRGGVMRSRLGLFVAALLATMSGPRVFDTGARLPRAPQLAADPPRARRPPADPPRELGAARRRRREQPAGSKLWRKACEGKL
jgi:hypothetical protein